MGSELSAVSKTPTAKPVATDNNVLSAGMRDRVRTAEAMLDRPKGAGTQDILARQARPLERNMQFSQDPDTGRTLVQILDKTTGEVIRQIPTEEAVELARAVGRMQSAFVSSKA